MNAASDSLPDVFSAAEVARAAGATAAQVQAWIEAGAIRTLPVGDGATWIGQREALRAGRAILDGTITVGIAVPAHDEPLFAPGTTTGLGRLRTPLAVSGSAHVGVLAAFLIITSLGLGHAAATEFAVDPEPLRLVYLALPGPGGGGGGGGLKQLTPPPKAERKGAAHIDSPVPTPPPPLTPEPPKADPPPPPPAPIQAPVVEEAAKAQNRDGQIAPVPAQADSHGAGEAGGVGTGKGSGIGEGTGPGLGEGDGGGTGGGPFRPGSGIDPPTIRREVKPDYTEDARRRNIRGEVLMEIVVKRDGTVGDVRVVRGMGYGLDERAVDAVRQWMFNPATRKGVPVDVLVEVSMEFRLR